MYNNKVKKFIYNPNFIQFNVANKILSNINYIMLPRDLK